MSWVRALSGKQIAGLCLVGILYVVAMHVPGAGGAAPLTADQSSRIGWEPASTVTDLAHDVYERINDERAARGLAPLAWDADLSGIAQGWSEHMIRTGVYEHSPDSYRAHIRFVGSAENIAMGQRSSTEVHVGWMRSEGHRRTILSPDLDAVGVGVVCRKDGVMWATQVFGVYEQRPPRASADTSENPITRQDPGVSCPGADAAPWSPFPG